MRQIPLIVIIIVLTFVKFSFASELQLPHNISSFKQAKKIANKLYQNRQTTFYCGCKYTNKKQIKRGECGYVPRKNKKRGKRIEWEHIVPAHAFGHVRQCWREPKSFATCQKKNGKFYRGRKCCNKVDPVFRAMAADLHNLVPSVGELNGDRSNFRFGMIDGEPRKYGACDFEVDFKRRITEPAPHIRGDIARIYEYMETTYAVPIGKKQRRLFEVWKIQDPMSSWEQEKKKLIQRFISRDQ